MRKIFRLIAATLIMASSICFAQTQPIELPRLNIDVKETSVSGISSGGFMAVQLSVAYSSIIKGVGIVAAGPYYCAQRGSYNTAGTLCSCTLGAQTCAVTESSAKVPELVSKLAPLFRKGLIDDPANISHQHILTFAGKQDNLVPPTIVKQLASFYRGAGVSAANVSEVLWEAGHTMPTWDFGEECTVTESPYLGKCRYDGAKEILSWIYGALKKPAARESQLNSRFFEFNQRPFIPSEGPMAAAWDNGLDVTGWVYIPKACADGATCRLHVALHGCEQGQTYVPLKTPPDGGPFYGTTFVKNAGYAPWADANDVVILYPQAISIPITINPKGCWDWWGFTARDHYADQKGYQMRAIRAMIDRLTSGRH
ncbi:extracellular catalytic domain type 2 short-chain-length polyhydroxyalkanoate depolymerase [Cupriavidus lacunae]|uniref:Poly(3-hydroxybutyrate) depolymerase n=1 Tax=Cupriavidus lacunae TaxID=2666307 RepID=A0A370MVI6_9BURK|nr:poly(3-hydroxybutyrate) depolymerase [Cupriavidus lacunae]RDJ97383.1 poly(3-hydroxybutyrate) depolymerase [Cupriavidus lacunae]